MATEAQIAANQQNAQNSAGATTREGRIASARNNFKHGLCPTSHFFALLSDEDPAAFSALNLELRDHYQPQDPMEIILVRRMVEAEWLRARAIGIQTRCIASNKLGMAPQIPLFLRYQTAHERAFYKAVKELQTLREQKTKAEIGFERQKLSQSAETRAVETFHLRKQVFEFQKQVREERNSPSKNQPTPKTAVEIDPEGREMVA